jgi:hypothetical protein
MLEAFPIKPNWSIFYYSGFPPALLYKKYKLCLVNGEVNYALLWRIVFKRVLDLRFAYLQKLG